KMPSTVLCAVILLACALTFSAAQTSCRGRCGAEYYRGYMCQCDYSCLSYGECCKDYESQCTTKNSCKGRCGETFKRGRLCSCDSDCLKYKQCCPDYKMHCDAEGKFDDVCSPSDTSDPISSDNPGTILPQPITAVDDVSSQPNPTSASQTEVSPTVFGILMLLCRSTTLLLFFLTGHYFWFLDRNRVPGPARGITQVWGVPSPIDTVFTRCNCQGKTYIFKGAQYWRFENDVLDPGYPKVIETGFDGLRGHITAALSVPQYQRRRESVYFFKRGGLVQKYSYQFGTGSTCGKKPQLAIYTVRSTINIRTSWRGFPSTITAAVSIPINREPEGYKYYVFSRSKSYNVRMDGERPAIAEPKPNASPQSNDIFKCPKKV
uniref:SMB domain-containing protein n=1 Tax=Lates calcarifer TaxID=8187 RepID=A0A4W6CXH3_LATCA